MVRHFLVTGRVQGVSFRAFTQFRASELGLDGWVRNLRDGRVEVLASGPDDKMAEFESQIARGPQHARVDRLDASTVEAETGPRGFRIREDGESVWSKES